MNTQSFVIRLGRGERNCLGGSVGQRGAPVAWVLKRRQQVGQDRLLRQNRRRAVAPRDIQRGADTEKQDVDAGVTVQVPGTRTGKSTIHAQAAQAGALERDIESSGEVKLKRKGREDNQDVKAEIAVDGEAGGGNEGFDIGAELQGI